MKSDKINAMNITNYLVLITGILVVILSALYLSSYLAILGVAFVFFGAILLYIKPTTHVPLIIMNEAVISATTNIERRLAEAGFAEKGRYLPPSLLNNINSCIVFIPQYPGQSYPKPEETKTENFRPARSNLMLLTPPGLGLSNLFEKKLGTSFLAADLDFVRKKLPDILVEDLELAQNVEMIFQTDAVTLEVKGNVLRDICEETRKLPRTHSQVGCLLSSAFACVLAKASGKVVTIEKDEVDDFGVTRIEYRLKEP
jgi:hypothetical protein